MCEYCGCQQIAIIAELTREHDAVVTLVGQIRIALPSQRRGDVAASCRQILAILAPHTVVEEEGLFPEMTQEFPDHIEVLRSEHREIEKVLGEATGGFPEDRPGRTGFWMSSSCCASTFSRSRTGCFRLHWLLSTPTSGNASRPCAPRPGQVDDV